MSELRIWAVSDGRAGIENQALGLAEAVGRIRPAVVETRRIAYWPPVGRLPQRLNVKPLAMLSSRSDPIGPPWPDVWIAAGRATLPLSARVREWSGGRTFVVQLQHPRWPLGLFDLVIPPEHDGLEAQGNVYPIIGSPHRVTPERLAEEWPAFAPHIEVLPTPRTAVLVGGKSSAYDLPAPLAARFAEALVQLPGSLLVTFSRRTPKAAQAAIREGLRSKLGWIWDGDGPNPYFAFLHAAEAIVVTADSTNMAVEAAATGKPVLVQPVKGRSPRHERLHEALRARHATRPFVGRLEQWMYAPLRETERAAIEVVRRLADRGISAK